MDNAGFLKIIANNPLVNKSEDDISSQVESLKQMGILEITAEVPDFWNRITTSFSLAANTSVVDMVDQFSDYDHVKFFWTDESRLDYWPEEKYRKEYPNGNSTSGKPVRYSTLGNKNVLFDPTNTVATTINIVYVNNSEMNALEHIPSRWHHVLLYYVLQFFDDPEKMTYTRKYEKALAIMKNYASEADESDIEIERDGLDATIADTQTEHRSR